MPSSPFRTEDGDFPLSKDDHLFKRIASLVLLIVLGLVVSGAVNDAPSIASYPVIVATATFVLTALAVLPIAFRPLPEGAGPDGFSFTLSKNLLRTVAFCFVWIAYAALLNSLGFVLASSLAMVASLWIVLGRFRLLASASSVIFVLALAVLVTTILFVPVPKGQVDHWIDETIFTLMGR